MFKILIIGLNWKSPFIDFLRFWTQIEQDIFVINDPLGQTKKPASSYLYFYLKFVLFFVIFNWGRTDMEKCENSDPYGRDCGLVAWIKNFNKIKTD